MSYVVAIGFLISAFLSACDSNTVVVLEGPEEIRVDLQYRFEDDLVVVEIDGNRVYQDRVSTNDLLSLADIVTFSIPTGPHRIRVAVNQIASSVREFQAGVYKVVAVTYNPREKDVDLTFLTEAPLYD